MFATIVPATGSRETSERAHAEKDVQQVLSSMASFGRSSSTSLVTHNFRYVTRTRRPSPRIAPLLSAPVTLPRATRRSDKNEIPIFTAHDERFLRRRVPPLLSVPRVSDIDISRSVASFVAMLRFVSRAVYLDERQRKLHRRSSPFFVTVSHTVAKPMNRNVSARSPMVGHRSIVARHTVVSV